MKIVPNDDVCSSAGDVCGAVISGSAGKWMMMFGIGKTGKQKDVPSVTYDPARQKAVLRCSICTGEQVAGFQDIRSGKFEEVMLIRGQADLLHFKEMYGIDEVAKIY